MNTRYKSIAALIKEDNSLGTVFGSIQTMAGIVVSGDELIEQKKRISASPRDAESLERAYRAQDESIDFLGHMVGAFDDMVKCWHDCPESALIPDKETLKDRKSMLAWAKDFWAFASKAP